MALTYEPIVTTTLTTGVPIVELAGIPQGYTDLVLEISGGTGAAVANIMMRCNLDNSTTCSGQYIGGFAATAYAANLTNKTGIYLDYWGSASTDLNRHYLVNILNYSNTNVLKTTLLRAYMPDYSVESSVSIWRGFDAITSLKFFCNSSQNIVSGTVFTLYGIKAA